MRARFDIGDRVRVIEAYPPGHIRTPYYIRGKPGVIADRVGFYKNPEELAQGNRTASEKALYRVRFKQTVAWPDYTGPADDTLDIDIYEHWLEPNENRQGDES